MLTYDLLTARIIAWAESNADIRAALILGSRARNNHPADAWSDLDVMLFAHNPEQFINSGEWAAAMAPSWLTFVERAGGGDNGMWERRTLYEDGLDVDVAFVPAEMLDGAAPGAPAAIPPEFTDIIRRGVKLLLDKDGKLAPLLAGPLPETPLFQKPSAAEFHNAVSDFWYHTVWSTKHLRRGELWWAKSCVDMYLKGLLQRMLEWHARAVQGDQFDTWLRGRFLDEWADPRAVKQLRDAFAKYDAHDVARALRATMKLYRWLEDETAARWGYACPLEGERQAALATTRLLDEIG
jgi:aminoglycoside 6-adenylyltransferase